METVKDRVDEGDYVMLKKAENLRVFQVHRKRDIWLEKSKFCLDGLIGQQYGTLFEVKDGGLVLMERPQPQGMEEAGAVEVRDNRNLLDEDSNQRLTQEQIEQMKKEGVSGDKLIGHLIENSATFQSKTGYAQEKWVKKKKKNNLRVDSLAQMLTMGNVRAGSTVLVVDSCLGLVTAAVLERLGGFGRVVSFYQGDSPLKATLQPFDFPQNVMDTLYQFPLDMVNSLKHPATTNILDGDMTGDAENTNGSGMQITDETVEIDKESEEKTIDTKAENSEEVNKMDDETENPQKNTCGNVDMENITKSNNESNNGDSVQNMTKKGSRADRWGKKDKKQKKDRSQAKLERAQEIERARRVLLEKEADCLLVATKFHPSPIVLALADIVAPSRPLVVFSQFKEALQDCYVYLREHKGLVNYRLTETWLREYQVLPSRTHPVIQMSGTGGYLLSATTICRP
ncbi:TRM6-like protein [Mya arenaria]|uniref:tRNA (adenine(58)-N(1))-methyltransferase non-catalytic subunit TRM6 n=1 Tax=Mya arenaria TaxID=6604 RepID=A0ABY7FBT3_MYAAR|nr:TRM6-like protein [Mya arenaria]